MKKKLIILTTMLLGLTFAGCNGDGNSNTISDSSSSSVVENDSEYYYVNPNEGPESFGLSTSDDILDIDVDKELVIGCNYSISYSLSSYPADSTNVTSSNEKVFTLEKVTDGKYNLILHHAGDANLVIMDSNGLLRYRHVVHVRNPLPLEDLTKKLINVDSYASLVGDSLKFTFISDNQVIVDGSIISTETMKVAYTATYEYEEDTQNGREYFFKFTDDVSLTNYKFIGFAVSKSGDFIYLRDNYSYAASILVDSSKIVGNIYNY